MDKYVEPKGYITPEMKKILDTGKSKKASDFSKSKTGKTTSKPAKKSK